MTIIYRLDWTDVIGTALTVLIIYAFFHFFRQSRKAAEADRKQLEKSARLNSRVAGDMADTLHGNKKAITIEVVDSADGDGEDYFANRQAVGRAKRRLEQSEQRRRDAKEQETDEQLDSWFAEQQQRARHVRLLEREVAAETAREADSATGERNEANPSHTALDPAVLDSIGHEVKAILAEIQSESVELDYYVNQLETSLDFIAVRYQEALQSWKDCHADRHLSLNELKHRFRLESMSHDDAWGLVFSYSPWIDGIERRLVKALALLGSTERQPQEALAAMLARIESGGFAETEQIQMESVFLIREVRNGARTLGTMRSRLKKLEKTCQRKAKQVISPDWQVRQAAS